MNQGGNSSTAIKTIGIAGVALLALSMLSGLLSSGRMGYGYNMNYGQGFGFNFGGVLAGLLMLLIKILWFVLIVSLVIGLIAEFKKYRLDQRVKDVMDSLFTPGKSCTACGTRLKEDYKYCPKCQISLKVTCQQCGKELEAGWQCCPSCGTKHNLRV